MIKVCSQCKMEYETDNEGQMFCDRICADHFLTEEAAKIRESDGVEYWIDLSL